MASNKPTTKGTETVNEKGGQEIRVETVDYRSSAGQPEKKENVEVIHEARTGGDDGGVLAGATAAVANTIQSAKDVIPGNNTKQSTK